MRLAPEETSLALTGFEHNAVTCVGMKTDIPVNSLICPTFFQLLQILFSSYKWQSCTLVDTLFLCIILACWCTINLSYEYLMWIRRHFFQNCFNVLFIRGPFTGFPLWFWSLSIAEVVFFVHDVTCWPWSVCRLALVVILVHLIVQSEEECFYRLPWQNRSEACSNFIRFRRLFWMKQ